MQSTDFESALESEHISSNQETENTLTGTESNQLLERNEPSDQSLGSKNALCNENVCEQIETPNYDELPSSADNDLDEFSETNLGTTMSESLPLVMSKVNILIFFSYIISAFHI